MSATTGVYDVAIVGAGPAGLFGCHEITRLRPETKVVLIDRGPDLEERVAAGPEGRKATNWLSGFGGAGFFIGGRMSFDLDTATGSPTTVPPQRGAQVAADVDRLLTGWGAEAEVQADAPAPLLEAAGRAAATGLTWHLNYPARHLSPRERLSTLTGLRRDMGPSVEIRIRSTVEAINRADDGWAIETVDEDGRKLCRAHAVLMAPGRAGAEWLARILRKAGASVAEELSVGIRVEARVGTLAPLTDLTPDPRLSLALASGRLRTYAFAVGGRVSVTSDTIPRVTVRPGGVASSPNSSFALLWQASTELPHRRRDPGAARLADVGLDAHGECGNDPPARTLDLPWSDIKGHWPDDFWYGMDDFIHRMDSLAPGIASGRTLAYSPAIETVWTYRLGESGETELPALYLAGDGAGISQGAMAAAISGVMAGRTIAGSVV